jgi:peptidoglycan/xylan/chitin deacetylase (PgdA/CDA1 family)
MTIIRNSRSRIPGKASFRKIMIGLAALIAAVSLVAASSNAPEPSVGVLCYHAFLDRKNKQQFCFSIDELASHIARLRNEGFRFVSASDIFNNRINGARNILITVDDGNRSVYEAYLKVFKPNQIRPLLAIYPHVIGKERYALTWRQLRELSDDGCDIAAHGYFHLKLDRRLFEENPRYFNMEIYESKKVLERKLNRRIDIFVYPFGESSDSAMHALMRAGYRYAFTIDGGVIHVPVPQGDSRFRLPRYMLTRAGWKYSFNRIIRDARQPAPYRVAHKDENPDVKSHALGVAYMDSAEIPGPDFRKKASAHKRKKFTAPASPLVHTKRKVEKMEESDTIFEEASIRGPQTGMDRDLTPAPRAKGLIVEEPFPELTTEASLLDMRGGGSSSVKLAKLSKSPRYGVGKEMTGYYAVIKKSYSDLTRESYATYKNFLRLVRRKINGIKDRIKGYVVRNF